jgi:hypothetical protein
MVCSKIKWSRASSGSIVSDCGLDDRAIGVRSPAGAKDFSSSLCLQTGSGANPASCTMGTGGPFPGGKARPGRDADQSPPSSAEVENEYELYLLPPQAPPWHVEGLLLLLEKSILTYFSLVCLCRHNMQLLVASLVGGYFLLREFGFYEVIL